MAVGCTPQTEMNYGAGPMSDPTALSLTVPDPHLECCGPSCRMAAADALSGVAAEPAGDEYLYEPEYPQYFDYDVDLTDGDEAADTAEGDMMFVAPPADVRSERYTGGCPTTARRGRDCGCGVGWSPCDACR